MLQSRNRSLKRRSRIGAFFVIVTAGCLHRVNKLYQSFSEYSSSDTFIRESPLVPDTLRKLHEQSKQADLRESLTNLTGQADLPAQTIHELEYK